MLRRSPLSPGTKPLKATAPLVRKTPLQPRLVAVAGELARVRGNRRRRHGPAVPADVRAVLLERSGGWCELQLHGCHGQGTDPAHRISVKGGGRKGDAEERHNEPSNVLWACRSCHDWCHARPAEAYELGLMLREWHDPLQEPVLRRGELVYLTDDGRVIPFEEVGP